MKLDEAGKPCEIIKRIRTIAESIIEEFMLVANETIAEHMSKRKRQFIYRIHEEPESEKILKLSRLLNNFGYKLNTGGSIEPKVLQKALGSFCGEPEEKLISTVMLRSLRQARYDAENLGHFGLAAKYYTHFTSPIRRYPDLIVHRLLRQSLNKESASKTKKTASLSEIALHCSVRERAAADAERESVDLKKVEYMEKYIGQEFDGTISGVTSFGIFVELGNGIEGLIHVSNMDDDFYQYIEERYALVGERLKKVYRLGDKLTVLVAKASVENKSIDFVLPERLKEKKGNGLKFSENDTNGKNKKGTAKDRGRKKELKKSEAKPKKRRNKEQRLQEV